MKLQSFAGDARALASDLRKARERGYTFGEVLLVIGVIAALAVGAFALFTQLGGSTEITQVAGQIGERAGGHTRMIQAGLRSGRVSGTEFAGQVGTLISNHKFVTGGDGTGPQDLGTPEAVTEVVAGTTACDGTPDASAYGFRIKLSDNGEDALDAQQLAEFTGSIQAAIATSTGTNYGNTFEVTTGGAQPTGDVTDLGHSPAPRFGNNAHDTTFSTIIICLNDGVA